MLEKTYKIFGRNIRVAFDDSQASTVLERELSLYPMAATGTEPDLWVAIGQIEAPSTGLANPKTHQELSDGFITRFGSATVQWQFENGGLRGITFSMNPSPNKHPGLERLRNMQFTSRNEIVGQVFHELVLVPAMFFDRDRFPLHASGFQHPDGGVVLIGGTGGVGKTSLELMLCREYGYDFVADDIAMVEGHGHVWPNLSYPKIYGYNLEDDRRLRERLFSGRSWLDRLNWTYYNSRGPEKVRRRISPEALYGRYSQMGGPLRKYVFIAREIRSDFAVERVSSERMAKLSTLVLEAEYQVYHRHLLWHEMNRLIDGKNSYARVPEILQRWANLAVGALASAECKIIRAPRQMEHAEFKSRMAALIHSSDD